MRYYLKHLLELYGEYMSVALVGMFVFALVLSSYSAMRSGSIVLSIVGTVVLLFSLSVSVNVVKSRYRSWRENQISLQQQRGALALEQLVLLEQEAHSENNQIKMEAARKYLLFLKARGIRDDRAPDRRSDLLNDIVKLLDRLRAGKVREARINEAVDKFLTSMEQSREGNLFPSDRSRIIGSIVIDALTDENKEKERKFVS